MAISPGSEKNKQDPLTEIMAATTRVKVDVTTTNQSRNELEQLHSLDMAHGPRAHSFSLSYLLELMQWLKCCCVASHAEQNPQLFACCRRCQSSRRDSLRCLIYSIPQTLDPPSGSKSRQDLELRKPPFVSPSTSHRSLAKINLSPVVVLTYVRSL